MDYTKQIETRFKRCVWIYDYTFLPILKARKLIASFYGDGRDKTASDICCGTGGQSILLAKNGYEVVGMDISEDMLKIARKKTPK